MTSPAAMAAPPYRLNGVRCVMCDLPAVRWYPGRYVDHGHGRGCLLTGSVDAPIRVRIVKPEGLADGDAA